MLNRFIEQARTLWSSLSASARIGLVITAAVCLLVIVGVGYWSSQPQYVELARDLDPTTAKQVVSALEAEGIDYRQNQYGTNVLVDQNALSRASLATAGILPQDNHADLGSIGSPLIDPSTAEYQMRRQLEQRLANAIMQIGSVEKAQVILGIADDQPFARDQQQTTASVVIRLKPSVMFSNVQAQSIVAIVSRGVPGLQPQNVNVVDTHGNVLSGDGSPLGTAVTNQLEYRRRLESDLAFKAESMLQSMLGMGKAQVRDTAYIDITEQFTKHKTYDP
jgi:flagellar M-ring protein FliF